MIEILTDGSLVAYIDADFRPVDKDKAALVKLIQKDGSVSFLIPQKTQGSRDMSNLKMLFGKGWVTIEGRRIFIAQHPQGTREYPKGTWRARDLMPKDRDAMILYHDNGSVLVAARGPMLHSTMVTDAGKSPEWEDGTLHAIWIHPIGEQQARAGELETNAGALHLELYSDSDAVRVAEFLPRLIETGADKNLKVTASPSTRGEAMRNLGTLGQLVGQKDLADVVVKVLSDSNVMNRLRRLFHRPPVQKAMTEKKMKAIIAAFDAAKTDEYQRKLADAYIKAIQERVEDAEAEVGASISFDVTHPDAIRYALEQSATLVKGISDTTRDDLRQTLAEGLAEGKEIDDIADDITDVFAVAKGLRAETIARTETARAYVWGSNRAYKDAGIEKKEWLLAPDYDPSEDDGECEEFDGMIVPVEEDFGGEEPPLHPNCRCDIAAVDTEETEEEGKSVKRYVSKYKDKDRRAARVEHLMKMREPTEREMRNRVVRLFQTQQNAVLRAIRSA